MHLNFDSLPQSKKWNIQHPSCLSLSLYSHTLMQQSKTNCCPLSLQSPLLQPVNGGINMLEWRESLSFVGVEGPVISCLGSQEAAASIQLCKWVCVCVYMWDACVREASTEERVMSWNRQSVPGIILLNRLPVLVIHTFSTWCSCALAPVAFSRDKQWTASHCLIPSTALSPPVSQSVTTQSHWLHVVIHKAPLHIFVRNGRVVWEKKTYMTGCVRATALHVIGD